MYIIENYSTAVLFTVITMLCWGSWGNTQKLTGKSWRFELFYWDYVIGILLFAVLLGFTLGSNGTQGRSFIPDILQANKGSILNAFFGGVIFNASNILLVTAMAIAGMAVAFPVGVGIALVLGVLVNYINNPKGNALILIIGVAFIGIAIIADAIAYHKLRASQQKVSMKGILFSILAGLLMAFFYYFVAKSMFIDFENPTGGKLSPYSAVFFFAIGILVSNFLFNTIIMKKPVEGQPVDYHDYFRGSIKSHLTGILGGIIWMIGMSMNIIASGKAGFAISYGLGQGATLVAALWGVFIWKEFKGAGIKVNRLIAFMFLAYIIGLILIIVAGLS
ncbi:MAG: GRP family sugar transporter [Bacteroidales bacterium]